MSPSQTSGTTLTSTFWEIFHGIIFLQKLAFVI